MAQDIKPDFVVGDTGSKVQATVVDENEAAIDLTGATVQLKWSLAGTGKTARTMTVTDETNGVCEYQWVTGDLDVSGAIIAEVVVTDASSHVLTQQEPFEWYVRRTVSGGYDPSLQY